MGSKTHRTRRSSVDWKHCLPVEVGIGSGTGKGPIGDVSEWQCGIEYVMLACPDSSLKWGHGHFDSFSFFLSFFLSWVSVWVVHAMELLRAQIGPTRDPFLAWPSFSPLPCPCAIHDYDDSLLQLSSFQFSPQGLFVQFQFKQWIILLNSSSSSSPPTESEWMRQVKDKESLNEPPNARKEERTCSIMLIGWKRSSETQHHT